MVGTHIASRGEDERWTFKKNLSWLGREIRTFRMANQNPLALPLATPTGRDGRTIKAKH